MSAPEALVRLRGAAFGYGRKPVISAIDLEVAAGDVLGIVGPNGAGKTTLFRGILGLIPPLAGSVERLTREVGYVPQRERLDPIFPLSVEEVVHMGCYGRLSGLRRLRAEERDLAGSCLERVGLADRRRGAFSALSGGQRQRVLIARALMSRPRLLLLDEPTTGVDRAAEESILEVLRSLESDGIAMLLVSHQLGMVRAAAPEVLWIAEGAVTRGRTADVLQENALDHLFIAGGRPREER